MTKATLDGKGLINSTVLHYSASLREVKARTQTRQEPEGKSWQRLWRSAVYLLAPHGLLSLLTYSTQDHQHRDDATHDWLSPPTSITKKRLGFSSVEVPSFLMTLACFIKYLEKKSCIKERPHSLSSSSCQAIGSVLSFPQSVLACWFVWIVTEVIICSIWARAIRGL